MLAVLSRTMSSPPRIGCSLACTVLLLQDKGQIRDSQICLQLGWRQLVPDMAARVLGAEEVGAILVIGQIGGERVVSCGLVGGMADVREPDDWCELHWEFAKPASSWGVLGQIVV